MTSEDPYYASVAFAHGMIGLFIFISGIIQFILKKFTFLHRSLGYLHLVAWTGILVTGAYIGSVVIVAIVILGFYLSLTGVRAAMRRNAPYALTDHIILFLAFGIIAFLLYASIVLFVKGERVFSIISLFFFLLYAFVVGRDFAHHVLKRSVFKDSYGAMNWYVDHMTRMLFSFLTAIGAFAAVQHIFNNTILDFILPAVLGAFLVQLLKKYYLRKAGLSPSK